MFIKPTFFPVTGPFQIPLASTALPPKWRCYRAANGLWTSLKSVICRRSCRIPQQIYPAAYFTPSAGVATTVAYQLPAAGAAAPTPAAAGPYSPRAVATSPAAAAAAAASPFFDLAVPGYPGLTTIPAGAASLGYDAAAAAAAYGAGPFGAIPAAAATGPTAGGYLIAAGGHDGLGAAPFATAPPSAMTQYALHYQ